MARRHLTSVHHDGPEAPKACPRIARLASIRTHNNIKVPEHLNKLSTPIGYPLDSAYPRKARCMASPSVSSPQSGGTPGRYANRLRIYEFYSLRTLIRDHCVTDIIDTHGEERCDQSSATNIGTGANEKYVIDAHGKERCDLASGGPTVRTRTSTIGTRLVCCKVLRVRSAYTGFSHRKRIV